MVRRTLLCLVVLVGLPALAQCGQPPTGPGLRPDEEICGFTGNVLRFDAASVRQGLAVELLAGDVQAHHPATLRFLVNLKPRSLPVDDLQVEHEKFMHVLGVRDDLSDFIHLHPRKAGPGLWAVSHTFTNSGRYKFWTQVKYRGVAYVFGHPRLTVATPATPPAGEPAPVKDQPVSGCRLDFTSAKPLLAGRTNQLQFTLRAANGAAALTERFLGAPMHLVIVKDDLSVMLHAHPETHRPGQAAILFHQVFPRPGNYRLFAQYRPPDLKLPPDDALLAEFTVSVPGDSPAAPGNTAR